MTSVIEKLGDMARRALEASKAAEHADAIGSAILLDAVHEYEAAIVSATRARERWLAYLDHGKHSREAA